MGRYESMMMLWKFMDLTEKERLMYLFTQKHGEHFTRDEFFDFLAERYDDSQIAFEAGEPGDDDLAA